MYFVLHILFLHTPAVKNMTCRYLYIFIQTYLISILNSLSAFSCFVCWWFKHPGHAAKNNPRLGHCQALSPQCLQSHGAGDPRKVVKIDGETKILRTFQQTPVSHTLFTPWPNSLWFGIPATFGGDFGDVWGMRPRGMLGFP